MARMSRSEMNTTRLVVLPRQTGARPTFRRSLMAASSATSTSGCSFSLATATSSALAWLMASSLRPAASSFRHLEHSAKRNVLLPHWQTPLCSHINSLCAETMESQARSSSLETGTMSSPSYSLASSSWPGLDLSRTAITFLGETG